MTEKEFINEVEKLNITLTNEQLKQLKYYLNNLIEYNQHTNLTAIKNEAEIYLKHFYDSLTLTKISNLENGKLLDVGTGAGFPGLVLAIVFPKLQVTLLDSNNKKITYLNQLITKLNLKNIELINQRAEIYTKNHQETFDFVTSRAVAQLRILVEINIPALKINGSFLVMKANINDEITNATSTIEKLKSQITNHLEFELPYQGGHRTLLEIKKLDSTPKEYPRNYEKIKKKSL